MISGEKGAGVESWASLAPVYDRLFPPGRAQLDFISTVFSRMPLPARRILDVGCATGGYALALSALGYKVVGVDLCEEMVRQARTKADAPSPAEAGSDAAPRPLFVVADMTDLKGLGEPDTPRFDGVICLGNTLAGALSAAELGASLGEMARVLTRGGKAILQVVNYDRIAATGEARFPLITLDKAGPGGRDLVFRRLYVPRADGLITFKTSLEDPETGTRLLAFESLLRPVVRDELEVVAGMAFHGDVEFYGDFLFSAWDVASPATIAVATRGPD